MRTAPAPRPLIPAMRAMLYIASALVFSVGVSLYLLTEQTEVYFAWTIKSFLTASFLGAAYWSSCVLEFAAARQRHWSHARVALPAVIVFTALTLVVTLLHLEKFHFSAPAALTVAGTWFWLAVYALVPIILSALLVPQLRAPGADPPRTAPLPAWMRGLQWFIGATLTLLGLALFLAPEATLGIWPWALTPLTARAVGVWLIGLGLAGIHTAYENDLQRTLPLLTSMIVFCALQFLALARYPGEFAWGTPAALVYLIFLLALLTVGVVGVLGARATAQR